MSDKATARRLIEDRAERMRGQLIADSMPTGQRLSGRDLQRIVEMTRQTYVWQRIGAWEAVELLKVEMLAALPVVGGVLVKAKLRRLEYIEALRALLRPVGSDARDGER